MILIRKFYSKKEERKNNALKAASIAGTVGGVIGSNKLGDKISEKMADKLLDSELTAKDKDIIKDKLIKEAKKQGTRVVKEDYFPNAAYTGNGKGVKKALAKLMKVLPKDQRKQVMDALEDSTNGVLKHLGKDRVVLGDGPLSEADVLSHELGHSKYTAKGRSKNIIAKGAHKLMVPAKIASTNLGSGLSAIHGFHSGRKQIQKKNKGEKVSLWDKSKSVILPTVATAPLLIAEGSASLKGLRMMKKAGASKELMKQARKRLGAAWGTYAGQASKPIVSGVVGNEAGKLYEKSVNKKDKKD